MRFLYPNCGELIVALGSCRECGANVSTKAASCPHCGVSSPVRAIQSWASVVASILEDIISVGIKFIVFVVIVVAVVWWWSLPPTPEQQAANEQATTIARQAAAAFTRSDWKVEIDEATPHAYGMTLWYAYEPTSYANVENDTRSVIRMLLSKLQTAGVVPSDKNLIRIYVEAARHVSGETGQAMVREYGRASYNSLTDGIEFKRP